jgi:hypothetical protein
MTVTARYEISHPDCGVITHCASAAEAFNNRRLGIEIFDRMAHRGLPELWRLDGSTWRVVRYRERRTA